MCKVPDYYNFGIEVHVPVAKHPTDVASTTLLTSYKLKGILIIGPYSAGKQEESAELQVQNVLAVWVSSSSTSSYMHQFYTVTTTYQQY